MQFVNGVVDDDNNNNDWYSPNKEVRIFSVPMIAPTAAGITSRKTAPPLGSSSSSSPSSTTSATAVVAAETIIECIIIVISLVGNILVLASIFGIRALRSKKTNLIFVFALTMADLLVTIFVMPLHVIKNVLGYWPFGQVFCDIFVANDIFFCTASLLGILCIAVERYVAVFKPLRYNSIMTTRVAVGIVCMAWLISLIVSHVPVHLHIHYAVNSTVANPGSKNQQQLSQCNFELNPGYAIASSLVSFWLPCIIMGFVYVRIYFGARSQLDALLQAAPLLVPQLWPFPVEQLTSISSDSAYPGELYKQHKQQSPKLTATKSQPIIDSQLPPLTKSKCSTTSLLLAANNTKQNKPSAPTLRTEVTLGRILGCFILSWTPFFTLLLLDSLGVMKSASPEVSTWLFKTAVWIAYANSAINPFIYAMSNHEIASFMRKARDKFMATKQSSGSTTISSSHFSTDNHHNGHRFITQPI